MAGYIKTLEADRRTYATVAALEAAVEKLETRCDEHFTVVIAAAPDNRVTPVLVLRESQLWRVAGLASNGFFVVRV